MFPSNYRSGWPKPGKHSVSPQGDTQPHGSYEGRRHQTLLELKLGQNGVKAGGEVQGGFGYQLSVT